MLNSNILITPAQPEPGACWLCVAAGLSRRLRILYYFKYYFKMALQTC
jgi:hypothetical protein